MRIQLEVIYKENFKLSKWQQKLLAYYKMGTTWAAVVKNIQKNYKSFITEQNKTMAKVLIQFLC